MNLMIIGLFCYVVGILTIFIPKKSELLAHKIAQIATILGSACVLIDALSYLGTNMSTPLRIARIGNFALAVDGWSAGFLVITGIGGILTGIYGIGYGESYVGNRLRTLSSSFACFVFSMVLVLLAQDAIGFLLAWEIMAIVSFLLVNHECEKKGIWQVAYQYLVMTHIGTAAIMIAFLLVGAGAGNFEFKSLEISHIDQLTRNLAFVAAFIGFSLKAGLIPLHVWLPNAHPAAPSHVSALMSGVMLKIALYGFGRFIFEFLGPVQFWWGALVFVIALLSAFAGALYAQMATDIKRILAYSSVENMGIIFTGIGAGMMLLTTPLKELAYLGFIAALVHAFNHSIMKSLMFMAAGSIMHGTGTKNIEKMGGLAKYMPKTAICVLVGSMALAALPLTNGFLGEWLTLQTFIQLISAGQGTGFRLLAAFGMITMGLAAAFALSCFVRFYGNIFLGRPRTHIVEKAKEAPFTMCLAMQIAAILVMVLGILPVPVLQIVRKIWAVVLPNVPILTMTRLVYVPSLGQTGAYAPLFLAAITLVLFVVLLAVVWRKKSFEKKDVTWNCGTIPTARQQYSATGFSKPIRRAFGFILKPVRERSFIHKDHDYFGREIQYDLSIPDRFTENFYVPVQHWLVLAAAFLRKIQAGSVRLYISYVMVAMVLALIWGAMQ